MSAIPWILISIAVIIILLGIFVIFAIKSKKIKQREPDYYTFFIMGIIWTIFGAVFFEDLFFFLAIGLTFLIIGLMNKDKWNKNRVRWKDLSKFEKKFKIWMMITLGLLALLGLIVFFLIEKGII